MHGDDLRDVGEGSGHVVDAAAPVAGVRGHARSPARRPGRSRTAPRREADVERLTADGREHRRRRARGHALVAPGAVDDVRPQPDRRHARARRGRRAQRPRRRASRRRTGLRAASRRLRRGGGVGRVVDGGRARVGDVGDAVEPARDGVEDVDGAGDVDVHPERRVRADERHLQRGEVDDAGDLVLVERALDGGEVGDVALHERDRSTRRRRARARAGARSLAEVEADDRRRRRRARSARPRRRGSRGRP